MTSSRNSNSVNGFNSSVYFSEFNGDFISVDSDEAFRTRGVGVLRGGNTAALCVGGVSGMNKHNNAFTHIKLLKPIRAPRCKGKKVGQEEGQERNTF